MKPADDTSATPLLADRVRLKLMAALAASSEAVEFMHLLEVFQLTKGNLSTHMRKLEDAGLVAVEKTFVERKSRTAYLCTTEGRKALQTQLDELEALILSVRKQAS